MGILMRDKVIIKQVTIILAFLITLSSPVAAQNFNMGRAAFEAGDYAAAKKILMPLANAGNADAQYNLGLMYEQGAGVTQSWAESAMWQKLAAKQGHVKSQYALSIKHITGTGVLMDGVMGYMWANIASANGYSGAGKIRDGIAKSMTPAAIEKAQAMARECVSSGYTKCGY